MSRERAAALLWPEHGHAEARGNLRKVLFAARSVPGAQGIEAGPAGLRWAVETDLRAFRRACQETRHADALALHQGLFLDGLDAPSSQSLSEWLQAEREQIREQWHRCAMAQLQTLAGAQERLDLARALLAADALDEAALQVMLRAWLELGQAAQAQRQFAAYSRRLAEELGVEPARHLRELMHAARAAPTLPAAPAAAVTALAPDAATAFIGRSSELAELVALLQRPESRLLTVLGPGGMGKTRFVRQALPRLAPLFPGGVVAVEMEDLTDVPQAVARMAQQLGVEISGSGDAVAQVIAGLPAQPCLLVLDNAEHLQALPALVQRLLDGGPLLRTLVTSRTRCPVAGEMLLPLAGLERPDDDSRDLEAASAFDAVRLFDDRARRVQRDFELARHLDAVLDITEAVGGLPLAIELAAGWVRLLPPAEIARSLRSSIDLLERNPAAPGWSTPPATPARTEHSSMRIVLERSWQLLAPAQRDSLAALAVFEGGFTHGAARAVAQATLPVLSSLVDHGLLAVDGGGRFTMHPLVAAYAAERLADDPLRETALRERHAAHLARLLAELAPQATGDQRVLVHGINAEFANCGAAWRWAVRAGRVDWVAAMVRALWAFFENRGRQREGIELLSPALALPDDTPAARHAQARLRHGLSMLHHRVGDAGPALHMARSGTAMAAGGPDTEAWVGCVLGAGNCLWRDGKTAEAIERFEFGVAIARKRGDRQCTAWALGCLGVAFIEAGRPQESEDCLLQALAGSREVGDLYNVGWHLANLGRLGRSRGDRPGLAVARRWYEQALQHAHRHDIAVVELHATVGMGHVLRQEGDLAAAHQRFQQALKLGRHNGRLVLMESVEQGLAWLALAAGDWAEARRLVQSLVRSAQQRDCASDLGDAVLIHADWLLAARGDPAAAGEAMRCVLQIGGLSAATRQLALAGLAALPAPAREASVTPTPDDLARRLLQG